MSEMSMRITLDSLFYDHPLPQEKLFAWSHKRGPILIAHRGANREHPENTLPAFLRAMAIKADMLELDVRLSKDNEVVVVHDPLVDRTANDGTTSSQAFGPVASFTLKELQAMGFPALKDVYFNCIESVISVELKDENWLLCEKVVELTRRFHRLDRTTVELIAVSDKLARRLRKHAPDVHCGHTTREIIRFTALSKLGLTRLFKKRARLFEVPMRKKKLKIVTPRFVRAAHKKGIRVFVWTVNDPDQIRYLCKIGVDGLYTDDVAAARVVVNQYLKQTTK
jgi:glycerophosphoryl diester phosphodiesterase